MSRSASWRRRAVAFLTWLTVARIVALPIIMVLLIAWPDSTAVYWWAGLLFAAAAATDFLDGYLARRWDVTTTLGSFLDTTADKLLVTGVLITLVEVGRAWAWVAVVIIGRELVIMGLRGLIASSGAVMKPSIWGKLKANVQFVAILLAIWRFPEWLGPLGPLFVDEWAMIVAAGVTVMSGWEYLARFRSLLSTEQE
jgi:CDP-diacylglycerol--glycerol-3-phosphate 3-phosphatidyltransferase